MTSTLAFWTAHFCAHTCSIKKNVPGRKVKKSKQKKTLMSSNCLLLRREVRSLVKKLQKDPKNVWIKHTFSNCVKKYNKLRKNLKQQFYNSFVNKINELHPNYSIKAFGNH